MNKQKIDFSVFISGLMAEGLAAMGLLRHEAAAGIKKDLKHADMVIETLAMIKDKTAGNLSDEEQKALDEILHQLRMAYVTVLEKKDGTGEPVKDENEISGERSE